ncbi:MAG TPA: hypothetical protein VKB19_02460 [Pedobacter sp.]|nr:hypothetical protein [Pedobacter sp.]
MLGGLTHKKLQSATIVETVIALLILMISFASGMVIYGQIVGTGVNQRRLQAETDTEFVLDSLLSSGGLTNQQINRGDRVIEIQRSQDKRYNEVTVVKAICRDISGQQQQLAVIQIMVIGDGKAD